ncbi:uncharacterized protein LOC142944945 isoform X1 [Anarhichas minor]|uniref:uncharacterized protein LOC142944945 isoform X1 n=1 Tax=Anarhichas minor TaxID=65739 RepID=UPI003F7397AA
MSESGSVKETEELQDLQSELSLTDVSERPSLKDNLHKNDDQPEGPRRSERARNPTEKMLVLQGEEAKRREKRLLLMYEKWKLNVRKARDQLKTYMPESELWPLIEELKKSKDNVTNMYFENRDLATPSTDVRRRVDTCESITTEIVSIAYNRAIDEESEFNEDQERHRLHELLHRDCAKSVYGSAASISHSKSEHHSITSSTAAKRVDAAAELAVKEANYKMMVAEERQKEVRELEEQQRKALEAQKRELERLHAEKEVRAAQAKLKVYDKEMEREAADCINNERNEYSRNEPVTTVPLSHAATPSPADISSLAQVFQDSIALNRLPLPEPSIFSGDAMQFIEWKAAFTSLIDQRAIAPAEKLYYLKKYVGGPARQVLDGTFFRNDDEAYQDAWNKLNRRFGQPFTIQRAFREKLTNWPRIQAKDAQGLRSFSDFLSACQDALPHVKGLDILNDCEENLKLTRKLPDWAASSWNRQVTHRLNEKQEFPSLKDFAIFVSTEAEIACTPITSFHALHASDSNTEKRNLLDTKRDRASVLTTHTATDNANQRMDQRQVKMPCILCQDNRHQLHACPKFMEMLAERHNYVREKKLCYGCLKSGHSAKDCRHRHFCDNCKGKHPTVLHDYSYGNERSSSETGTNQGVAATSLSVAGEGASYTSMVMPVWVSSKHNPTVEKLVYALLDTQSNTTFIDQEVSDSLAADKYPVKLKLTTMTGKNTVLPTMGGGSSNPAPEPPAPPDPYFSEPWRNVTEKYQENLDFVKSYQPRNQDVKHLRILLHGPVGSGKSSFINSVDTALKGTVSGRALTDAISGSSYTRKFKPAAQLQETDRDYISSPTLEDRVHVLVCVIPAGSVSLISDEVVKKLREVRQAATEMGIPQLAILTKVDEACPEAEEHIKETYRIKHLKEQVDKFSKLLGIPPNCIFLVKNYHSETNANDDINALILTALKQMITFGEDFLNDL